jgi:acetyl esterase/lipase
VDTNLRILPASVNPFSGNRRLLIALKKAGVPTEYHIYAEGGHAFGLNESAQKVPHWSELPIADWEKLVERWLRTIKMSSN